MITLFDTMNVRDQLLLCPNTELKEVVLEALGLLEKDAAICKMIERDLELAAKAGKKARLEDEAWLDELTPSLPGLAGRTAADVRQLDPASLTLGTGCPRRLDAEAVYIFMMCRGYLGSVTARSAVDQLRDSLLLHTYLSARCLAMPSRNCILTALNQISESTRAFIFDAQVKAFIAEGLDDGKQLAVDSFSVEGCTSWPTDSRLIMGFLARAFRGGLRLEEFGIAPFAETYIDVWLKELKSIDFKLSCTAGKPRQKRSIKKLYTAFLHRATKVAERLIGQFKARHNEAITAAFHPTKRMKLDALVASIKGSLQSALSIMTYAGERVFNGVVLPSAQKILSLSDSSAAFIQKGGREPVVGYKPQIGRSGNGFVTAFEITDGNPSDSKRLVPMTKQHLQRTGVAPQIVTADDGYSSRAGVDEVKGLGVKVVSISGAKGKHITAEADWEKPEYAKARADRSAVESIISVMRHNFDLRRFTRCGLPAVRAELTEKVIAYNFIRMSLIRRRIWENNPELSAA